MKKFTSYFKVQKILTQRAVCFTSVGCLSSQILKTIVLLHFTRGLSDSSNNRADTTSRTETHFGGKEKNLLFIFGQKNLGRLQTRRGMHFSSLALYVPRQLMKVCCLAHLSLLTKAEFI